LFALLSGSVAWGWSLDGDTCRARGKNVTCRGCLSGNGESWSLVVIEDGENTRLELLGDTSELKKYRDAAGVTVRGIRLSSDKLEVKHVEPLRMVAKLNKSLTDASQWIRKTDANYGLSIAFPKEASFGSENSLLYGDWLPNSVRIFDADFPIYPESGFNAHISIYVNTAASEKDTYPMGTSRPNHHHKNSSVKGASAVDNFEWVDGIKYTRFECEHAVRMDDCSVSTFQNGLRYRFELSLETGQPGMVEWGCLLPEISEEQESSFLRLFFSKVKYLKPEVPAADGRHISPSTVVPQIVRFEKTPLVQDAHGLSFSLSWEAINADYVQLSYDCGPRVQHRTGSVYQAEIDDPSFTRSCESPELPAVVANRPPRFSQKLTLSDQVEGEPVSVQITLTPYSHGDAFAQSSKVVSIEVPRR
jgi:hypothetical protein